MTTPPPDYAVLYEQERQAREQAETWMHVADQLNRQLNLDEVLPAVCQITADMLTVPIVTISLYHEEREELALAYAYGLPLAEMTQVRPISREVYEQFRQTAGQVVVFPNVQTLSDLPNAELYRAMDLRTTVGISMMLAETHLIGRLNIGVLAAEREFSEREIALLQAIANQAAVVIHRAKLYGEVQNYAAELEQRVADRTADLSAKNEELALRNEELDAFAHTVAHDLRSPLSTVIGYLDLLYEELQEMEAANLPDVLAQTASVAETIGRVLRQAEHMNSIIGELLLLASVRQTEIQRHPIDQLAVVERAWERLGKRGTAELILPPAWPLVWGYAPWLEEVWANYLSNALKYGGQPAQITVVAEPLPKGWVRYGVRDNGAGLTAEQAAQLFTPFTRLHHHTRVEGFGLGLSIVARILEKLGGRVGVESELGRGSLFYFELPMSNEQ